ncbi:MAG: hypothetical protein LBT92_02265 [Rickettsiales bacterium]|jgi:hypothetical protein|nr:hypothetical protein [Rickettsiales bacterium]
MKNVKTVTSGDEYKVLHTKSTAQKIANWFCALWILLAVAPAAWIVYRNADAVQKYLVVKGVAESNAFLAAQYSGLEEFLMKRIDLDKYAQKVKIPEINADGAVRGAEKLAHEAGRISDQAAKLREHAGRLGSVTNTANTANKLLGALGKPQKIDTSAVSGAIKKVDDAVAAAVAQAAGVRDMAAKLAFEAKNINDAAKKSLEAARKSMTEGFNAQIRAGIDEFGRTQLMRAWNLSEASYSILVKGDFGVMGDKARANTVRVYGEFEQNRTPVLKQAIGFVRSYWTWISIGLIAAIAIIGLVPVWIAKKTANIWTGYFEKCPYCGKLFIPKRAKYNLIKLIKWW